MHGAPYSRAPAPTSEIGHLPSGAGPFSLASCAFFAKLSQFPGVAPRMLARGGGGGLASAQAFSSCA